MLVALRADPFDPAAVRAALGAQRDVTLARQDAAGDAWLAQIEAMDDAARVAYTDRLEGMLARGKRGRDRPREE